MNILSKTIFNILIYLCQIITCTKSETTVNLSKPKLDLTQDWPGADWKFVNISDGTAALFSKNKDTLILNCSAPYPIQWKIEGTTEPPDFVTFQPYRRFTVNDGNSSVKELFSLQIIIFFTSHENTFSSAIITCEKIENPQLASSYAVFVPSDNTLLAGNTVEQQPFAPQYMIPCPTTDPTVNVTLYRVKDDNGELSPVHGESLNYSPTRGFSSSNPFGVGTFVCLAKHDNGNESSLNFTIPNCVENGVNREPLLTYKKSSTNHSCYIQEVKAFVGETLEIFCSTPNYIIIGKNVSVKPNASIILSQFSNQQSSQKYKIRISTETPGEGVIKCGNTTEIWNYQILGPAPELYLDNYESEVDCLSEYPDRSVSTVRCRDPSACDYMKHCLTNGQDTTSCNYRRQKHFHSQYPGRCWVQKRNEGASCASMPYYHLNGLVQCGGGGAVKFFMFFVGLDFHRYSNWREAPKNALIQLESEKFENRTEYFCQAAAFLFADSLKFSLIYANGTETFLDSISSPDVSNPSLHGHPKRMDEFNVVGLLIKTKPFPSDVIALSCFAPWWNSTDWMSTQLKLN